MFHIIEIFVHSSCDIEGFCRNSYLKAVCDTLIARITIWWRIVVKRPEQITGQMTCSAGPYKSTLGQRYRHVGSHRSLHREKLRTQVNPKGSLTEDSASHAQHRRNKSRGCDFTLVPRRSTTSTETFTNIGVTLSPYVISPKPRSQPSILPRRPLGQAMAVSRNLPRASPTTSALFLPRES